MAEKRLTHTITVDLAKETWSSRPVLVQNTDNTFFINVLHNEEPVDLSDVRDVVLTTVAHRKNDGDSVYSLGVKVGGKSQVKVDLGRAAVATPGIVDAQLKLLGVDGGVISSTTFEYEVQLDAGIKFAPSATDKTIIESVLGEGPGVIADATQTIADMESTQATLTGAVGGAISSLNEDKAAAIEELAEVREANRFRQLNAVTTVAERDSTYPNPEHGDTVRVTSDATMYKYDKDAGWVVSDRYEATAVDALNQQLADTSAQKADKNEVFLKDNGINVNDFDEPTRQTFLEAQGIDVNYVLGTENVVSENIKRNAVTIDKADFLVKKIRNWAQDATTLEGQLLASDLKFHPPYSSTPNASVRVIPVEPYGIYTITPHEHPDWDRSRYALFSSYPVKKQLPSKKLFLGDDNYKGSVEFTTGVEGGYLVVYLSSVGSDVPFDVIGSGGKTFLDNELVDLQDASVTEEKTTFIKLSKKNLYGKGYDKEGFLHSSGENSFFRKQEPGNPVTENAKVRFVDIEANTTYTITPSEYSTRNRYAIASADVEPTDINTHNSNLKVLFHDDGNKESFTFTSESDSRFLILYLSHEGKDIPCQVERGAVATAYEKPAWLDESLLPEKESITQKERSFILTGKFDEIYKTEPCEDMSSTLQTTTFDFIYDKYDELMAEYPDVISREHLGDGYNLNGEIDTNYPIYEYTISPPETIQLTQGGTDTTLHETPVILMTSGVHGDEKPAVYGLYEVVKQMMHNPQNKITLDSLKNNVTFKIIPVACPGGYNAATRNNTRGVNINRNFSYNGGSSALSEIETQVLHNWLSENRHAFAYLDFHNFVRTFADREPSMSSYHFSPNREMDVMYSSLIRVLSSGWKNTYLSKYSGLGNVAYGFLLSDYYRETSATINEAYHTFGIKLAASPESSRQDPDNTSAINTKSVIELTVEIFMNYILSTVDTFRN